jgi:hypothetical protein
MGKTQAKAASLSSWLIYNRVDWDGYERFGVRCRKSFYVFG